MYRGTALAVAATGAVTLAALFPATSLLRLGDDAQASRLRFASLDPPLTGLPVGTPRRTIPMLQQDAVGELFGFLLASAAAMAAVALVTLLMLWFARASAREGELAVRRAVGASRRVLLWAALLEGAIVFLLAVAAGAPGGAALAATSAGDWPGSLLPAMSAPIWLLVLVLGLVLLLGAEFPALFTARRRIVAIEATPVAFYFPALLQLGLCLIALTSGMILIRHVNGPAPAAPPLVADGQVAEVTPAATDRARAYSELLDQVAPDPGASLTAPGTLLGLGPVARITTECGHCYDGGIYLKYKRPLAVHHFVSADTFRLLGIRLVDGRLLSADDGPDASPVAVVSQSLANRHFQDGAPLGRGIQLGDDRTAWYTVVGIVADQPGTGFGSGQLPPEQVYLSVLQAPPVVAELFLPAGASPPANAMLGPARPVTRLARVEASLTAWFGRWLTVMGALMLLVAGTGLFAFARLWVVSLRPSLGLRRASGATRGRLLGRVLGQAALVGVAGVLLGAWFGPAVWLSLPGLLPGLPAWDPALLAEIGALLVLVMVLGAFQPAWRAVHEAPAGLIAGAEET